MNLESMDISTFPTHEYRTLIRENHLDTFGHVNNAEYLVLFEEARWEMITERGYSLHDVHKTHIGTVVLECSVRFRRELRLREKIVIRTRVKEFPAKRLVTLHQEIIKENGKLGAEATFLMGCFDLKERKLIVPHPNWLAAITGMKT